MAVYGFHDFFKAGWPIVVFPKPDGVDGKGKVKLNYQLDRANRLPTETDYANHLSGKQPLAICYVTPDKTIQNVTLDVDYYEDDLDELCAELEVFIPAYVKSVSKTGGYHYTLRFDEPVNLAKAQQFMKNILSHRKGKLKKMTIEMLPENDASGITEESTPRLINLPMFGSERPIVGFKAFGEGNPDQGQDIVDRLIAGGRLIDLMVQSCTLPASIVDTYKPAAPKEKARPDPPEYVHDDNNYSMPNPKTESGDYLGRDNAVTSVAGSMQARGWPDEDIHRRCLELFHERAFDVYNPNPKRPLTERMVEKCVRSVLKRYEKGVPGSAALYSRPEVLEALMELNTKHAIARFLGKAWVLDLQGKGNLTMEGPADLKLYYFNRRFTSGKSDASVADLWLRWTGRRTYDEIVAKDIGTERPNEFNFFRGFPVKATEGDVSHLLDHINNGICGGDEKLSHLFHAWLADLVQNPWGQKSFLIWALAGGQGAGKTLISDLMFKMLGARHAIKSSNTQQLGAQFNDDFFGKVLFVGEEIMFAGDHGIIRTLKDLSGSDVYYAERKRSDKRAIQNNMRFMLISNEVDDLVAIEANDRRFVIPEIPEDYYQPDDPRLQRLKSQILDDGELIGHYFNYLQNYEYDHSILVSRAPTTAIKAQQTFNSDPFFGVLKSFADDCAIPYDKNGKGVIASEYMCKLINDRKRSPVPMNTTKLFHIMDRNKWLGWQKVRSVPYPDQKRIGQARNSSNPAIDTIDTLGVGYAFPRPEEFRRNFMKKFPSTKFESPAPLNWVRYSQSVSKMDPDKPEHDGHGLTLDDLKKISAKKKETQDG